MKVKSFKLLKIYITYILYIDPSIVIADVVKIHPCNDLHTCKMEHEDDSESEIIQTFKITFIYI